MMEKQNGLSGGRITSGIRPNTLVQRTLDFVYAQLPAWRDDPDRKSTTSEWTLNSQLCDYLETKSRYDFPMVKFKHEEGQGKRRSVDLAAKPIEPLKMQATAYTIYDSILVLEGKRLPLPTKDRKKEYITGNSKKTGGIQRFRIGAHGHQLGKVAILGYIQNEDIDFWFKQLNKWIIEEAHMKSDVTCDWTTDDLLKRLIKNQLTQTSRCRSSHQRTNGKTGNIMIEHMWVQMNLSDAA